MLRHSSDRGSPAPPPPGPPPPPGRAAAPPPAAASARAKPPTSWRRGGGDPPQREIAEIGIERGIGVLRQEARLQRRHLRLRHRGGQAGQGHPWRGLRIGLGRPALEQQGAARLGPELAGMLGQRGQQQQDATGRRWSAGVTRLAKGWPAAWVARVAEAAPRTRRRASKAGLSVTISLPSGLRHNPAPYLVPYDPQSRSRASPGGEQRMAATIALVDDDRNILTSVSMTLEQEGFRSAPIPMARAPCRGCWPGRPTSRCSTSRCRGWTGWSCCSACASAAPCRWSS